MPTSWDYAGGTSVSDQQAQKLGLTLERKPRAQQPHSEKFVDTIHVLKDGTHIGTLVTSNDGRGRSDRRTMLPDSQLHAHEREGSTYGHDLQWLVNRHAARTGGDVQFHSTTGVLQAHGAEPDRYARPSDPRHVVRRRQDRHELLVHTKFGTDWVTLERRPTFQKGVRAPVGAHAQGNDPMSLHRAISAWKERRDVNESTADALISAKLREGSLPEKESLHTVALSHGYRPHREVGGTRVYRNPNGHEISVDRSGWSHYTPGATSAGRGTGVTELSVHLRAQRKPQTEEHTGASVMPGNRSRSYVLSRLSDYVYGRDKGLGLPGHNSVPLGLTPGGHEVPGLAARAYNDSHPSAFGRLAILQHVQDKHASSEPRRSMIADHVRGAFPGWTQNDHLAAVEGHRAAALDALDRHQAFTKMHDLARLSPGARGRFKIAQKQLEFDHANHLRIAAAHEDAATHSRESGSKR